MSARAQRISRMITCRSDRAGTTMVTCPVCTRGQRVSDFELREVTEAMSRRLSRIRNGPRGKGVRR